MYVNYGREEDYELLEDLGISVSGAIVIMRYSKVSRSSKVGTFCHVVLCQYAKVAGLCFFKSHFMC